MNINNRDFDDMLEGEEYLRNEIYSQETVKVSSFQYSVFKLKRKFDDPIRQDFVIDPEFQRHQVWNNTQKSELIESILLGIPIPIFYFFEMNDGQKQVLDGRQRLSAIFDYLDGNFKLSHLKILPDLNTKHIYELDGLSQSKIEDYSISAYVIQPPTPERIKFEIFERVNRGGTPLNNQEMRNALYQGPATHLLHELSESKEFRQATGDSIKSIRMKDRYVILRFLSFYMLEQGWINGLTYNGDIDNFLAKTMQFINRDIQDEQIVQLKNIFYSSMDSCFRCLGENAFRFDKKEGAARRPINMALFDVIAYFFSLIKYPESGLIESKITALKAQFEESNFSTQVNSTHSVQYRFDKVKELLKELKNAQ